LTEIKLNSSGKNILVRFVGKRVINALLWNQKRIALLIAFVLIATFPLGSLAQVADESAEFPFNIPRQSADQALIAFAEQADLTFIFPLDEAQHIAANQVTGTYTPEEAIRMLLAGTGLEPQFSSAGDLTVIAATSSSLVGMESRGTQNMTRSKEQTPSIFKRLALSLAAVFSVNALAQTDSESASTGRLTIEEVIVTAQKRETNLQDTALSLSVLGATELERRSLVSAGDYLNTVPSVRFESFGLGANQLVIRGLGIALGQSPTAGAYLADVPLSDALDFSVVDIKLVDMARVEVLRGPQGTLYGAGAMGGAVRQVPMAPALNERAGQLRLGYTDTAESSDSGYNGVGMVNLPLIDDRLALRVSAYHYKKAGYVDLISTPAMEALSSLTQVPVALDKDVGGHEYSGVRASLLFQATDQFDMTLMLGYQKLDEDRRSEITMSAGDYVNSVLDTAEEFRDEEFSFTNLVMNYELGWAILTSSTSLTNRENNQIFSHSRVIPAASNVPDETDKDGFFQELRIASNLDGQVQFVAGAYYEDIQRDNEVSVLWASPNLDYLLAFFGTMDPNILNSKSRSDLTQLAFFGELKYDITDTLTLTGGARRYDYERNDASTSFFGIAPGVDPIRSETGDLPVDEDGMVYKAGIDYRPTENTLLYGIWSQGFRLGQTIDSSAGHALFGDICDSDEDGVIDGSTFPWSATSTLLSDSLDNYELGGKFSLLGGRLNLNAAVYRIDWENIPVSAIIPVQGLGCTSTFNGGTARSQGLEFETVFLATENLELSLSASFTDAEYRDDLVAQKGDRLPFTPEYNGNLGAQYNFSVTNRPAFMRADFSWVGDSGTGLTAPDVVYTDAYTQLSMRAGLKFNSFGVEVFGTNLTNEDALVGVFNLDRGWRMEPRTLGVEVIFDF